MELDTGVVSGTLTNVSSSGGNNNLVLRQLSGDLAMASGSLVAPCCRR